MSLTNILSKMSFKQLFTFIHHIPQYGNITMKADKYDKLKIFNI